MAVGPSASSTRSLLLCGVSLLLLTTTTSAVSDWTQYPERVEGDYYYYRFFRSGVSPTPIDGPNNTGTICNPAFIGASAGPDSVVFSDTCGAGSAIRQIDTNGILTLSGSLTQQGYVDGPATVARFGAVSSGGARNNGLTRLGDTFYLADSVNNAIRTIQRDGTASTFLNDTNRPDGGVPMSNPQYVAAYEGEVDSLLYVADTNQGRILSANVLAGRVVLYIALSGFNPGPMVVSPKDAMMFYVEYPTNGSTRIGATHLVNHQQWYLGGDVGYLNSLLLSEDGTEVLYCGYVDGVFGVYALRTDSSPSDAPRQTATLKFPWPYADRVVMLLSRDEPNSWFAVTKTDVYVVSYGPVTTTTPDPQPEKRQHGIAAFPRGALPTNDTCLMSQFYYWIRFDIQIAFGTQDYLTQFVPLNDLNQSIPGNVNVSTWCGNITARRSTDGTIEVIDLWGPTEQHLFDTQQALTDSPWYWTQSFLRRLGNESYPLASFCFLNCTAQCVNATASERLCVGYKEPPRCDNACFGAVAASSALGVTGIALLILLLINPSLLAAAVIMVPII